MADYRQTHVVPNEGLPAWAGPDASVAPAANLDPGLDVMVIEIRTDWARIRCSNGWEAWVDHRRLIARPVPAAATPPPAQAPAPPPPPAQAPPPPAAAQPAAARPQAGAQPPTIRPEPQATPPPPPPGQPSAPWGTPGAAPGAPRAAGGFPFGLGRILAAVGALVFLISAWFLWIGIENETDSAYKIPAKFLLDSNPGSSAGLNLGIIVFLLGAAGIVFALIPGARQLRILNVVIGVVALVIPLLFIWQVNNLADLVNDRFQSLGSSRRVGVFDILDPGVYIAIGGAVITGVGGILALAQKRS